MRRVAALSATASSARPVFEHETDRRFCGQHCADRQHREQRREEDAATENSAADVASGQTARDGRRRSGNQTETADQQHGQSTGHDDARVSIPMACSGAEGVTAKQVVGDGGLHSTAANSVSRGVATTPGAEGSRADEHDLVGERGGIGLALQNIDGRHVGKVRLTPR
jgi:hypothetical protein